MPVPGTTLTSFRPLMQGTNGMVVEEALIDHRRIDNRYSNTIQMSILAREWNPPQ